MTGMVLGSLILAGTCIGVMALWYFATVLMGRDAREHRQQVRQLRRNRLQQKIAAEQIALEQRAAAVHVHDWGKWSSGSAVAVWQSGGKYPSRTDLVQRRVCEACGEIEKNRIHDGGWGIK